jgi:integrase
MNGKINNTLVTQLKPGAEPFEVNDTELKGFGLRMQPSGAKSFFVRYRLKGKQTRFVLGRTTELTAAQARDSARSILAGVNLGTDPAELRKPALAAKTLGEFIDRDYSPWVLAHRKSGQATLARIRTNFDALWSVPLTDVTASVVDKWSIQRLNHPEKPAKPATVNRDLVALKAAISRAVAWGILESHPLAAVQPSEVDDLGAARFLTDDERKRLHTAMLDREAGIRAKRESGIMWRRERGYPELARKQDTFFADHLMPTVVVSLNTGVRRGELFSLCWADIDFEKAQLSVRGSNAKSGRTRHVPLNTAAVDALRHWKEQCDLSQALVFPGRNGKRLVDIKSAWSRLLAAAKIGDFRWHDMRHDFASRLVMLGENLNTVRELLGHADLKMTLRYAHLAPEHKAAAVAKLAPVFP